MLLDRQTTAVDRTTRGTQDDVMETRCPRFLSSFALPRLRQGEGGDGT